MQGELKMKLKKKTAVAISFTVGIMMFATTAFAEVNSKSGYDQLKDSLKYTAKSCTKDLSSYTMDMSFVIKDGTSIVYSQNDINKYDMANKSKESKDILYNGIKKAEGYYYIDKSSMITKSQDSPSYYVTNFTNGTDNMWGMKNPFDEDRASDIEKIADAIVGNLKDSVAVNVTQDGSKEISGSLNNTQIPSLVNALVSFQFKNSFNVRSDNGSTTTQQIPELKSNIFVKNIKGNVATDKNGLIKSALGSGILSGTDKNGQNHNLTFEVLVKIGDINSTVVKKPDLSDKKTIVQTSSNTGKLSNPEKYIGKYSNNIVIEDKGKFIKIGESIVSIKKIDNTSVAGTYESKYINGYEDRNQKFDFNGNFNKQSGGNDFNADITGIDNSKSKVKGDLYINSDQAIIYFNIDGINSSNFNSQYNKVFN
jgi:hypothetical protein